MPRRSRRGSECSDAVSRYLDFSVTNAVSLFRGAMTASDLFLRVRVRSAVLGACREAEPPCQGVRGVSPPNCFPITWVRGGRRSLTGPQSFSYKLSRQHT